MIKKLSLLLGLFAILATGLRAQDQNMGATIPTDPDVRIGRLDNGLTYYIRHNSKPANQAEFYILHNVGGVQQDSTQAGLAHFLEHMAFNGTKNLPDKMLVNYLESIGVKFGTNLNAFTSQEMTVYNMSDVPLTREGIIDTALLILHDWSYFITLDPKEIDNERGVIIEERRTRENAQMRISGKTAPYIYTNNPKYNYEYLIGTEEFLRTFEHDALRDFYHRWYRTDLQAIIVVGDFDVDMMEAKIKKLMSDIPAVENPEPKVPETLDANEEPLVCIATDPELQNSSATVYIKRQALPAMINDKIVAAKIDVMLALATQMANNRLYELSQKPNAPFVFAQFLNMPLMETTDAVVAHAAAREGETEQAFTALYTEMEKIARYGFTPSEYERAQSVLMRQAQNQYENRNDRRNGDYIWGYINNYRMNKPIPSAEVEWQLDSTLVASTDLAEINAMIQGLITPTNQVIVIQSPEKEGVSIPTTDRIDAIVKKVHDSELEAHADNMIKEPLISEGTVLKGSPVKKAATDELGATVWTLKNGIKVVVKPTDFKANEVILNASTNGGLSNVSTEDFASGEMLPTVVSMCGLGKFSPIDLQKQLAGKLVSISLNVDNYKNGLNASSAPKDLETMLQLVYLSFTQPRFSEEEFQVMMDQYNTMLLNASKNPSYIFQDSLTQTRYGHNPRREMISIDYMKRVELDKVEKVFHQLYNNASDFIFTIVGNVDLNTLKPLVEKYIGSLPTAKGKTTWKNDGVHLVKGDITNRFTAPMETPKTTIGFFFTGEMPYSLENRLAMKVLAQVMEIEYMESIREDKGGAYVVGTAGGMRIVPENGYTFIVQFDTDPKMADDMMQIVMDELQEMVEQGPDAEDLFKVKEYLLKQHPNDLKTNGAWVNYLESYHVDGYDIVSDYESDVNKISAEQIKAIAAKILADGNVVRVIMDPAQ